MRDVSIVGIGQTPVSEHWGKSLRELGAEAALAALADAGIQRTGADAIDALYVGNGYGSSASSQSQLGALIADHAGLSGVEAFSVDAADASGGAALRTGYLAVASGAVDVVLVVGVEKLTDSIAEDRVQARNISLDADFESVHGATQAAIAGMLMQRYLHEYDLTVMDFEGFSVNAHANGSRNPNAMFRNQLRAGAFGKAPMVATPVSLFDQAPDADGAAAVVLVADDSAVDMVPKPVKILSSAVATDTFAVHDRADLLWFNAVARSTQKAFTAANLQHTDIDLAELHDSFTIATTLILEAAGFAERGTGWTMANDGGSAIGLNGDLPISTFGGLKSRGNPGGATGVYQVVEAAMQLRGQAGDNQVDDARMALVQNLGGLATTAITHILGV